MRNRWGKTEAFIESAKRTKGYSPDEWKAIKAEHAALCDAAYAALKAGKSPSDAAVMDIAERHRLYIDRWFYPCSHRMHCGLASMYESDERFATQYRQAWGRSDAVSCRVDSRKCITTSGVNVGPDDQATTDFDLFVQSLDQATAAARA